MRNENTSESVRENDNPNEKEWILSRWGMNEFNTPGVIEPQLS